MAMIGVAVIGFGYWGPNLVRNFSEAAGSEVRWICDLSPARLARANSTYPSVKTTRDYRDILADPAVDSVAIATPLSSHYELALAAIRSGRHVLIEKPIAATSEQARHLIDEAEKRGVALMVDHTFVYHGAVRKIREIVGGGDLGTIYYYDSVRVNLGMFQHDVDVLWDLAVHDLSIMDFILPERPTAVSAHGISHFPGQHVNTAYMTIFFQSNMIGHLHVNWLTPVKVRRTLLGGSRKMIVYDDLESSEKLKVYDRGITLADDPESVYKVLYDYRTGDMTAPRLDTTEPLQAAVRHFLECIDGRKEPITGGRAGLWMVKILEAATSSMKSKGRLISLDEAENK
jgi:predicted dehydrogenase